MKITGHSSFFKENLSFQWYNKRRYAILLMEKIEAVSSIDDLELVVGCTELNTYRVSNSICDLYFELSEGNQVKLLNFAFHEV